MSRGDGSRAATKGFERWRWVVAAGLLGMALGFGWGIADEPTYLATSTVVLAPVDGEGADPDAAQRFAEIGGSRDVANAAAGLLGDDVPGADLLADVDVVAAADGVSLSVIAEADQPDFAVAAADGYTEALIEVTADAAGDGEDPPLIAGTSAALPDGPSENRSALVFALVGLGAGLLLASLIVLALPRRSRGAAPLAAPAEASRAPEDDLGPPILASLGDPSAALRTIEPGVLALEDPAAEPLREAIEGLGLHGPGAPKVVALVPVEEGDQPALAATALGAAAAERGLRVLLVEATAGTPAVATLTGVPGAPGLVDYLDGRAAPREVLRSLLVQAEGVEPFPLVCVPRGDRGGGEPDDLAEARMQALAERLPRVYDLVLLLESPAAVHGPDDLPAHADGVVLISSAAGSGHAPRPWGSTAGEVPVLGQILIGE